MKTPLNVALRKNEVENPLLPRVILTSRKQKLLFCSKSNVNFQFLCLVFIYFHSFFFESYKTDLIFTLLFRCFTICSDMQSFHLEVEQLRQIFKCNNYPVGLIDQYLKTFLNKIYVPKRIDNCS